MAFKTLLITPPFTQLNTTYPATCYLKGFLDQQGKECHQVDLSIELFLKLFSSSAIAEMFAEAAANGIEQFENIYAKREDYIEKVDFVIQFLQNHEVTAAYQIIRPGFLPAEHRSQLDEENLDWAFGNLGVLDKAKHLATLFIEELGDFIQANLDEFFSFTRYAEQISRSASSFDTIYEYMGYDYTLIEQWMIELLDGHIKDYKPNLITFSIPFPGNLFSALRCSQFIKDEYPEIAIAFGGGYCNTELRSIEDPRFFETVDYMTLDDGEGPLLNLINYLSNNIDINSLERTFLIKNEKVEFINKIPNAIHHHKDLPAPTYKGIDKTKYLSFLDVMNPMHRLWSDGRWNKLTISHGCYWKQCSFCDVSLDYIGNYQNSTAELLVNKIEQMVTETGITGFHFVDEAAPPKMLKALAEELIQRKVYITWWTNIRFEKTFSPELCKLLAQSGCIAVTGGLEVASDRLLAKMKKGVDIGQVARVGAAFAENNIMVHAYLMYGFPTQTEQETIDALEVVRQLFENGCIQSAFWHKFTTTIHSPVGQNPDEFEIEITGPEFEGFAQNDLEHLDPKGCNHDDYGDGLKSALNNYLNGYAIDWELQEWFDFEIPATTINADFIETQLTI